MVEPHSGGPDFERSGPHSDSGSLSPSWDRERRGPPPPPGTVMYSCPVAGGNTSLALKDQELSIEEP